MSHEDISMILQILSLITSFAAAAAIIIKPIREKLFDTKTTKEGQRCMLRAEMLSIYYRGIRPWTATASSTPSMKK